MVDFLPASHVRHEPLPNMAEPSPWSKVFAPAAAEGSQDFILQFENRSSDCKSNWKSATAAAARSAAPGEERKQLGMLLSNARTVSAPEPDGHCASQRSAARKRSLSSMLLESEYLEEANRMRHTSFASGDRQPAAGDEDESRVFSPASAGSAPRSTPLNFRKPAKLIASGIDKDLLSLSLPAPNSSLSLELSSSNSIEREPSEGTEEKMETACHRSCCCSNAAGREKDSAGGADMLGRINASAVSSVSCRCEEPVQGCEDGRGTHDDAPGDASTFSSNEPSSPAVIDGAEEQALLRLDSAAPAMLRPGDSKLQPADRPDADGGAETHGLQLVHLLLKCADAAAKQNLQLATAILGKLYQGVSLYGDSMQRVAAYFAEGLAARIISKDSRLYSTLMARCSAEDFFSAFTTLYKVAPYFQFAHFTANQAILEAFEGHSAVHVVDVDIMQGFQWPSLIQALALRPGGPPHLRITGIGRRSKTVRETGRRLSSFAAGFDISFEFQPVVEDRLENLTAAALAPRHGEAIAVNAVLQMHRLLNSPAGENVHRFMHALCRRLNPRLVTLVEQEANHNATSFRGRFMEALHYYAAVFDSLDASLPQQSEERVKVEKLFFAPQIKNIVVCDGNDRFERHETLDLWQQRMKMAGFFQVPLSTHAVSQANLLLQFCPCKGYRLRESGGSVSLGWQERQLLTVSAWSC